ncbi:MAG TPA: competence protein ComFB [Gammaproteobacteria bacterium]|nr:competence protein ComFB [Gammaproteobacteria bacterium]
MHYNSVQNYYEKLVFERVALNVGRKSVDGDYLEDVACVALNHLPPRYIRHEVDMFFYLSPVEREEMLAKVDNAIADAVTFIKEKKSKK